MKKNNGKLIKNFVKFEFYVIFYPRNKLYITRAIVIFFLLKEIFSFKLNEAPLNNAVDFVNNFSKKKQLVTIFFRNSESLRKAFYVAGNLLQSVKLTNVLYIGISKGCRAF